MKHGAVAVFYNYRGRFPATVQFSSLQCIARSRSFELRTWLWQQHAHQRSYWPRGPRQGM